MLIKNRGAIHIGDVFAGGWIEIRIKSAALEFAEEKPIGLPWLGVFRRLGLGVKAADDQYRIGFLHRQHILEGHHLVARLRRLLGEMPQKTARLLGRRLPTRYPATGIHLRFHGLLRATLVVGEQRWEEIDLIRQCRPRRAAHGGVAELRLVDRRFV